MSNRRDCDAADLIDFVLGQCTEAQQADLEQRLEADAELRVLHRDVRNTFAAIELLPPPRLPEDLVAKTLGRIASVRRTDAILAQVESSRRVLRPNFGFREVGAVAASILLLAAVFVPSVRQAQQRMAGTACASNLGQVGKGLGLYAEENEGYLPVASEQRQPWLASAGGPGMSNSAGLFKLVRGGQAAPGVFQCPAVNGECVVMNGQMKDFPAAKCIQYSYQHPIIPGGALRFDGFKAGPGQNMVLAADQTPLFADGRFHRDQLAVPLVSPNHQGRGQNVLYVTLRVTWSASPNAGVNGDNIYLVQGVDDYRGNETPATQTDTFLLPAYSGTGK